MPQRPRLRFTLADTFDFILCCEETINNKPFIQPYNDSRDAIVFSFDGQLKPFLNYTKGYHRTLDKRPYFARAPRVINEIRKLMRPYRNLGGRVFVDRRSAFYVDRDSQVHPLCEVSWPTGIDIVTAVRGLKAKPKPQFVITARGLSMKK